jgi:hypothetical protein
MSNLSVESHCTGQTLTAKEKARAMGKRGTGRWMQERAVCLRDTWPVPLAIPREVKSRSEKTKRKGVIGARNPEVSTRRPFTPYSITSCMPLMYAVAPLLVKRNIHANH